MGVTDPGGRVPSQRRVALYITAAVPPPVARIESTMMARQVRPTSPEPECVTGLRGRESDEAGDVRSPSGPGSGRSHQEAGYMAATDLPSFDSSVANAGRTIHDASGFRSVAMRCSTPTPTSSQARGEPCDVPQAGHRASSRSERHFQGAVPLLRTSDQRVRASSLATLADSSASSPRRTALNAPHDGDQRRTQGADPALPLRRALAGGHHRLAARRPPLHRRAGAGRGRRGARASAPTTGRQPDLWSDTDPPF